MTLPHSPERIMVYSIYLPLLSIALMACEPYVMGKHLLMYLIHSGIASSGHIIPRLYK